MVDTTRCVFILSQALSVRALQELLGKEEVRTIVTSEYDIVRVLRQNIMLFYLC